MFFVDVDGELMSFEGLNCYVVGDVLIIGLIGDCWVVLCVCFDVKYLFVDLVFVYGMLGVYCNWLVVVFVWWMDELFMIVCLENGDMLCGVVGDWVM